MTAFPDLKMTKPTTIKIPSPSLISMKRIAEPWAYSMTVAEIYQRYMDNFARRLASINDMPFKYKNMRVDENGIHVDVDFDCLDESLLSLEDMTYMYGNTLLHGEFRKRVAKVYAEDNDNNFRVNEMVTTAEGKNRLLRNQPFSEWPPRWLTIYLWTLIGADISHDSTVNLDNNRMLGDADICQILLLELEGFQIY